MGVFHSRSLFSCIPRHILLSEIVGMDRPAEFNHSTLVFPLLSFDLRFSRSEEMETFPPHESAQEGHRGRSRAIGCHHQRRPVFSLFRKHAVLPYELVSGSGADIGRRGGNLRAILSSASHGKQVETCSANVPSRG